MALAPNDVWRTGRGELLVTDERTETVVANDAEHVSLGDWLTVRSRRHANPRTGGARAGDRPAWLCRRRFRLRYATEFFDPETGISSWRVTLATDSVLIEATAEAARMSKNRGTDEQYPVDWSLMISGERAPKSYSVPPKVSLRVRQLKNLAELQIAANGTTDSYEDDELVRETWTFTFRDGTDPVLFNVDHGDRDRPAAIDNLCRHLAGHL